MTPVECDQCFRVKNESDDDYNPMQIFLGQPIGWYSGDDGELCGDCMTAIMRRQS